MKEKDIKKLLQNKLKKSFSNVKIFEEGIDLETQLEFEKMTKLFIENNKEKTEVFISENDLFNESIETEFKKNILIELSFSDDVKAYRLIERFQNECIPELKKWAALALQKSRAHIEHSLSNEDKVYISSGLGGLGDKLRYFFVLSAKDDLLFSDLHKNILKKEIEFTISKYQGIVEDILFYDYYVTIVCLVSLHHSLDKIFKNILDDCNELGDFLSDRVIATNTEKINEDTIEKILNEDPETIQSFEQNEESDFFGIDNFDDDDEYFDDFDDDDFDDDDTPF
ncbi:MAG: hypothetical protein L3J35_06585 [Bacteroidales bacterium]|nr:hypothetical protein [Bacteroidales bacterium]